LISFSVSTMATAAQPRLGPGCKACSHRGYVYASRMRAGKTETDYFPCECQKEIPEVIWFRSQGKCIPPEKPFKILGLDVNDPKAFYDRLVKTLEDDRSLEGLKAVRYAKELFKMFNGGDVEEALGDDEKERALTWFGGEGRNTIPKGTFRLGDYIVICCPERFCEKVAEGIADRSSPSHQRCVEDAILLYRMFGPNAKASVEVEEPLEAKEVEEPI